ncbi:hypothetical protein R3P38DRAFT_2838567 [Favolaschia claudopus]|uniref:Uncharacterized protein n=1 Tax=Favolaschia claudopus TaxID=2862362 RepID=A0AAW0E8P4_9AGAR
MAEFTFQYIFIIILGVFFLAVLFLCVRSRRIETRRRRNARAMEHDGEHGGDGWGKSRPELYDVYVNTVEKGGEGGRDLVWRDIMPISIHPSDLAHATSDSHSHALHQPAAKQVATPPLPSDDAALVLPSVMTVTVLLAMPSPPLPSRVSAPIPTFLPSNAGAKWEVPPSPDNSNLNDPEHDFYESHQADSSIDSGVPMHERRGGDGIGGEGRREEEVLPHYELGVAEVAICTNG